MWGGMILHTHEEERMSSSRAVLFKTLINTCMFGVATFLGSLNAHGYYGVEGFHHLVLQGPDVPVDVGQVIDIKVRMTAVAEARKFVALDLVFGWDPTELEFLAIDRTGSVPLLSSLIPTGSQGDYAGVNEALIPKDGTGYYMALAPLGGPINVTADGVQIVTLKFKVLSAFQSSSVEIIRDFAWSHEGNQYIFQSVAYDGVVPGLDSTGDFFNAVILGSGNVGQDQSVDPSLVNDSNHDGGQDLLDAYNSGGLAACATVRAVGGKGGSGGAGGSSAALSFFAHIAIMYLGVRLMRNRRTETVYAVASA